MPSYINGIIIGILASVPLGPVGVICVQRTLSKGKLSGFISGLGAAFSDTIYAVVAGFSLSFIMGFIEKQMLYIQIFGAIMLIGLGVSIFRTNPAVELRKQRRNKGSLLQDFISVFFITVSNPLAVFLFLAFFASFGVVTAGEAMVNNMLLIGGVFLGAGFWWFVLASIVNLFRSKINLRRLWWLNKIAGSVIILLVIVAFVVFLFDNPMK